MPQSIVFVVVSVPEETTVAQLEGLAADLEHEIGRLLDVNEEYDDMRYQGLQLDTGTKLC